MVQNRVQDLIRRRPQIEPIRKDVCAAYDLMRETFRSGGKALVCGNGGSAADAEHWAGEMLKGFEGSRMVPPEVRDQLGDELASHLQGALPMVPLTGFLSLSSAYANDCDSVYTFAQLTLALGGQGDLLIALSTSGNSENVILAARVARRRGMHVLGLTGYSGGELKGLCDVCICVPEEKTFLVQELHLPVYHTLSLMLEDEFFSR